MKVNVLQEDGQWGVWIGLDGTNPRYSTFGFSIGCAATRDAAVAQAVAEFEAATDQLQQPEPVV